MKIIIWLGVAGLQLLILKFNTFDLGYRTAEALHNLAAQAIELHPSKWNWFYEAILIGKDEGLKSQSTLQSFMVLGLYHLIVVSGSHVLALEKIVSTVFFFLTPKAKKSLTFISLVLFSMVNRLQASCLRAFISWCIVQKKTAKPFLHGDLQFIVTCFCLCLQPAWFKSLSFQLSCGATLGLAVASSFEVRKPILRKLNSAFFCTLITAPLIFCIQPCLSWIIVPANTLALPLFESVLMPLSIFNILFRFLSPFTEKIFELVFTISDFFARYEKPLLCLDERRLTQWGLIYLLLVYFAWRFALPWFLRRQFWQNQKQLAPELSTGM